MNAILNWILMNDSDSRKIYLYENSDEIYFQNTFF